MSWRTKPPNALQKGFKLNDLKMTQPGCDILQIIRAYAKPVGQQSHGVGPITCWIVHENAEMLVKVGLQDRVKNTLDMLILKTWNQEVT